MSNRFKPLACGYHSHSDESLDGGSTVDSKVKRAVELGRPADCLTDHGVMGGLASHHDCCGKAKITSIHGIEAYLIDPFNPTAIDKKGKESYRYVHITVHFKNYAAYSYFCKLSKVMDDRALVRYGERKPLILIDELRPIANDITIGSGCLKGLVQDYVVKGDLETARKAYELVRGIAPPGNFYAEIFPHRITHNWQRPVIDKETKKIIQEGKFIPNECNPDGLPKDLQKNPNLFILKLAHEYGDPIVISEDSHLGKPEEKVVQDIRIGNGTNAWLFYNTYSMEDSNTWAEVLKDTLKVTDKDIEEWIDNSYKFIEHFKDYKFKTSKDQLLLPKMDDIYEVKSGQATKSKLLDLITEYGRMPYPDHPRYQVYIERLKKEVSVLADNGEIDLLPYFFVMEDICRFCRENGILFNTRGSAGGMLVLYLLGASITDPIKYNLSSERCLTVGRIKSGSLPDIDTDFSDQDSVFAYCRKKYGAKFARISIGKPLKVKSSIKDIERMKFGQVRKTTEEMTKIMPTIPQGVKEYDWLFGYTEESTGEEVPGFIDKTDYSAELLRAYRDNNPEIWDIVVKCLGVNRERSVHACGTIIASENVDSVMPLISVSGQLCTAFGPKSVEKIGGVKFDLLRVKTLNALQITMKSIEERHGKKLTWQEFPHDPEVYRDIIEKGKLAAIFQLNTDTVRPYVKQVLPKNVEDISTLTALIRPGTLDAPSPDPADALESNAVDHYIKCRQGKKKAYYIHPDLEPILDNAYGVPLYQEQSLEIFRKIGDYTYETAEAARRAIGKKKADELLKELNNLKNKALEKRWTEDQATKLCDMLRASARYSFNKSHSCSYSIVAYNGCWLKKHYPLDFWKGELTANADEPSKIREYLEECNELVLSVDVEKSHPTEWRIEQTKNGERLRPPLTTIKWVGLSIAEGLQEFLQKDLREFKIKETRKNNVHGKIPKNRK